MSYLSIITNNYEFHDFNTQSVNQLVARSAKDLFDNPYASLATITSMTLPLLSVMYVSKHNNKILSVSCLVLAAASTALFTYYFAMHADHQIFNHLTNSLITLLGFCTLLDSQSRQERIIESTMQKLSELKTKFIERIINEIKDPQTGMAA